MAAACHRALQTTCIQIQAQVSRLFRPEFQTVYNLPRRNAATHSSWFFSMLKSGSKNNCTKGVSMIRSQQACSVLTETNQVIPLFHRSLFSFPSTFAIRRLAPVPQVTTTRSFPTLHQILRGKRRTKKDKEKMQVKKTNKILRGPQRKGVCVKVFIRKPKKPNSANRKCALLRLNNGQTIIAYIPGEKASLQEHGVVLFQGGRVQDCPGVRYKIVRGKYDVN